MICYTRGRDSASWRLGGFWNSSGDGRCSRSGNDDRIPRSNGACRCLRNAAAALRSSRSPGYNHRMASGNWSHSCVAQGRGRVRTIVRSEHNRPLDGGGLK